MSKKVTDLPAGVADAATFYAVSGGNDTQVPGGSANGVATLDGDTKVPNAQLHLGENGGPAGPLDANGHLPSGQVPPMPRELGGEVATEADMLALNVAAPAECIRTDFTPPHIFYLSADPATDVSNWHDLGPLSAGAANPTAKVGLTPTNGVASTFMRSDASPAIDEGILAVKRTSGNKQLELNGDELIWPNDIVNGKVRLWNTTPGSDNTYYGFGIQNGTLVYQVDSNTSKHAFQGVDDSDNALPLAEISHDGGFISHVDLHMSEQKIANLGAPTSPKDAANKAYVDSVAGGTGSGSAPTPHASTMLKEKTATVVTNGVDLFETGFAAPSVGEYCVLEFYIKCDVNDTTNNVWLTPDAGSAIPIGIIDPTQFVKVYATIFWDNGSLLIQGRQFNSDGSNGAAVGSTLDGGFTSLKVGYNNTSSSGTVTVSDVRCLYYAVV